MLRNEKYKINKIVKLFKILNKNNLKYLMSYLNKFEINKLRKFETG